MSEASMSTASLRERGTAMTDDEIVEVLAKAAHDASPYRPTWEAALDYERDIFRMEQRAALAALRKAGCEVVVRAPVLPITVVIDETMPEGTAELRSGKNVVRVTNLTGPESNNG